MLGRSLGRLGRASWPVDVERWTCLVAVPTAIAGAAGLMLVTGAFGEKYSPDKTESTIAVDNNGGDCS